MKDLVHCFADVIKQKDTERIKNGTFHAGIGSFEEEHHLDFLEEKLPSIQREIEYNESSEECDLKYNNNGKDYYIEFKLCRPYKNNGKIEEFFYKTIFSPFDKNTLMTDVNKLFNSTFVGEKVIMFVYYEKAENENPLLTSNNIIDKIITDAKLWYNINLRVLVRTSIENLVHPIHQRAELVTLIKE